MMRLIFAGVLIASAVLLPLLLFGSLVRDTVEKDVVARGADDRLLTARLAAASIDRELRSTADRLALFGSGSGLQDALRARDERGLDRRVNDLLRGRPNALGGIIDPAGAVLAAPLAPELIGQDFSFRDYFQGALASEDPYVSEVFASASAGNPSVVAVSFAVRGPGRLLGVVVLTLAPADLLDLLQPLRQVDGRELLIVDRGDRVVAATDPTLRPLASVALPKAAAASNDTVEIAGKQRIVTAGPVGMARWTLYVVDDPAVVLMGQQRLLDQLRGGAAAIAILGLLAAGAVVLLYGKTVHQRDELAGSRAALVRTNEALEEASRHKSDFLASMSHELRTPLNAILGFSELLQEQIGSVLTDRQQRYLRNIGDAGQHLLGLINDVLDLSKVEAGRVELRPELISMEALLEPVLESTRTAADAAGLRFDVIAGDGAMVAVDPGRVRQILYNLLSNAVKFTRPGGRVELIVAVESGALDVTVRDTGIGIPDEKRDRVFGTFERLHEGRSEATGTGLGLALTKRLAELHGGTVDFASRESDGTAFHVRLPDVAATGAAVERLLVVEDERRDADLIVALAARRGLESEVVTSVAAATAAIRRSRPTAVVLDLRLAGERGERVLEVLKEDPATRDVPVVVVTVEDDEGRSRVLGADDHITKPIDHRRLEGWLEHVAARRSQREVSVAGAAR